MKFYLWNYKKEKFLDTESFEDASEFPTPSTSTPISPTARIDWANVLSGENNQYHLPKVPSENLNYDTLIMSEIEAANTSRGKKDKEASADFSMVYPTPLDSKEVYELENTGSATGICWKFLISRIRVLYTEIS